MIRYIQIIKKTAEEVICHKRDTEKVLRKLRGGKYCLVVVVALEIVCLEGWMELVQTLALNGGAGCWE